MKTENYSNIGSAENGFELLYCEYGSTFHHGPLNTRSPFYENLYPNPSLAPKNNAYKRFGVQERLFRGLPIEATSSSNNIRAPSLSSEIETSKPNENGSIKISSNSSISNEKGGNSSLSRTSVTPIHANQDRNAESEQPQSSASGEIDNIYNSVKKMMTAYSTSDYDEFLKPVSRILSMMVNWELLSDKEIKTACKALSLIAHSKVNGVLAELEHATIMMNLLNSQNIPLDIQLAIVIINNNTSFLMSNNLLFVFIRRMDS